MRIRSERVVYGARGRVGVIGVGISVDILTSLLLKCRKSLNLTYYWNLIDIWPRGDLEEISPAKPIKEQKRGNISTKSTKSSKFRGN